MITYPNLGKIGRLGNHLFQMAATIGAAEKHGDKYGFPRWHHESDFPISGCFHETLEEGPEYHETAFSYDPVPVKPGLRLHGFFQSEKYFEGRGDLIRHLLMPHGVVGHRTHEKTASIHVRRGDYFSLPDHHPILALDYYRRAIDRLRAAGVQRFLVFSDDLPWCRQNFKEPGVFVIPPMRPLKQLALTIECGHHIMANSTFSWWGAWLNPKPDKIVIAPARWFGPGYAHYDTKDLLPEGWIKL